MGLGRKTVSLVLNSEIRILNMMLTVVGAKTRDLGVI